MKKFLLSILTLATVSGASAQTFFTQTSYRGAFEPAPANMWTQGWTEWDPQNKIYPAPTATVNGNITSNTTWASGQTVLLQGPVYVKNNAVLTIQPGVTILGSKAVAGSALIITKGAQINATGNSTAPIVFTSDQAAGARSIGDWGGLIILGSAALNYTNGINNVEGLPVSADTEFGGGTNPNNNDNSGVLQFVRVEFGGYVYQPNKEINGLTFGAVGKGTTVDHIQVSFTNDDGFEWFGGTVNSKYLVSYRNLDDDFDTDNGYSGNVQFGLIVRDPNLADNPAVSTSEGFESDNDASGTTATPVTAGIFSNITMVGPYRGATTNTIASGYRRALRLRRSTNLKVFNSIFMDTQRGVHIDGANCETAAGNGNLKFKHNLVAGYANARCVEQNASNSFAANAGLPMTQWFGAMGNDSILGSSPLFGTILTAPYNYTNGDYRPGANSPALATASFTDAVFNGLLSGIQTEFEKEFGFVMLAPNPANDKTTLTLTLHNQTTITANITDVTGKLISNIISNEKLTAGKSEYTINTYGLAPGIYFVTLQSMKGREAVKLIITN